MKAKYNESKEFEEIRGRIIGSTILISGEGAVSGHFSSLTATSPSLIFDVYDNPPYIDAMERPWKYCSFVLIDKFPADARVRARYQGKLELLNEYYHGKYFIYNYYHNESWRTEFLKHYYLVLETERYLLFERVA